MLRVETVFGGETVVTPDFAARLAQQASRFTAKVYLESDNTQLSVDSLIGILALDLYKGKKLVIAADGPDEEQAAEYIARILRDTSLV